MTPSFCFCTAKLGTFFCLCKFFRHFFEFFFVWLCIGLLIRVLCADGDVAFFMALCVARTEWLEWGRDGFLLWSFFRVGCGSVIFVVGRSGCGDGGGMLTGACGSGIAAGL